MRYWWVNQNQTYGSEVHGGFMWSPKTRSDGGRNQFYDNMTLVRPGDVVFSYSDTRIKALGVVKENAISAVKPDFGSAGQNWSAEGWYVAVEFTELDQPMRPKDNIGLIRPHLPEKYSPLQKTGDGIQSVYLAEVPKQMANVLIRLTSAEDVPVVNDVEMAAEEQKSEEAIKGRTDIGPAVKTQLINARRGQGVFKTNVKLNEKSCRVTGVNDPRFLIASHIKPWKDSNDEEKLHGCNGLLLAPHVDRLFDRGMITFTDDGQMLVSKHLKNSLLKSWGISTQVNVGSFNKDQAKFMDHHRKVVFKR